jgi:uncharacterized protein YjgD (DUF1641 family)
MIEILFILSILFFVYAAFALIGEQVSCNKQQAIEKKIANAGNALNIEQQKSKVQDTAESTSKSKTKTTSTRNKSAANVLNAASARVQRYLKKNGPTSVAKLVRELPDDDKTVQRSIGWLAQDGSITLEVVGRAETVAAKD